MRIIILLFLLSTPAFAQLDSARHYLNLAADDGSIEHFNKFAEYYNKLDKEQKENSKLTYDYMPYYHFLSILFTNRPNAGIFNTYLKTSVILKGNAEGSEFISGYFSYYFTNNMSASLEILEKINDEKIISNIISEAAFHEANMMKIKEYVIKNRLQKKSYYKFIKDYLKITYDPQRGR